MTLGLRQAQFRRARALAGSLSFPPGEGARAQHKRTSSNPARSRGLTKSLPRECAKDSVARFGPTHQT